jgi:hypothetical protein
MMLRYQPVCLKLFCCGGVAAYYVGNALTRLAAVQELG